MTGFQLHTRSALVKGIGALLALELVVAVGVYSFERVALRSKPNEYKTTERASDPWLKVEFSPVVRPPIRPAEQAGLSEDEEVIGVEVDGKARAYRISALTDESHHVVNDLIGAVPVSVTYCDLSDCIRVYTDEARGDPLDVGVAGLFNGEEMVVRLKRDYYLQKSGAPVRPEAAPAYSPYALLSSTRTTWKAWKRSHPDTEVYEGDGGGPQK